MLGPRRLPPDLVDDGSADLRSVVRVVGVGDENPQVT
jgi:hypothetical protein